LCCPDEPNPSHLVTKLNEAESSSSKRFTGGIQTLSTPGDTALDMDLLANHNDGWCTGDDEMVYERDDIMMDQPTDTIHHVVCPLCEVQFEGISQSVSHFQIPVLLDCLDPLHQSRKSKAMSTSA
jgi:hypothetical protein